MSATTLILASLWQSIRQLADCFMVLRFGRPVS
jgi:hypothetical protein